MNMDLIKTKRMLCIIGGMDAGGAETFLMKIYRALDKTKYQMDFCVAKKEKGFYDDEILSMGGKIFHYAAKTTNPLRAFINIRSITKEGNYKYVIRVSQHSLSALELIAAKAGGARVLVYRSSNSNTCGSFISQFLHKLFNWLTIIVPTIRIAPSTEAAEFMFGKNCIKKGQAVLVKNAIEIEKYLFDPQKRIDIREEYNLKDKFVIGHVGRFCEQKNHSFLIDIFADIVNRHANSILVLVGEGPLKKDIKKKVETLNLTDKVIFTGVRSDVQELMMAMDIYIFPSLFEGMPNTVIEAQATGLPCIISDTITKEAQITDLLQYMPINSKASKWANAALKYKDGYGRKDMKRYLIKSGYDINQVTRQFEKLIFE